MTSLRQNVVALIKDKIGVDNYNAIDLERGIYNWTIDYSTSKGIVKNWGNSIFQHIYQDKCRSVLANLDKNAYIGNNRLIERLLAKEFLPHEIPYMKPENVFPEKWEGILDAKVKRDQQIGEQTLQSMTDQFKCGKCKRRETVYYERQIRSADEPATLFIRCLNCNTSWRM